MAKIIFALLAAFLVSLFSFIGVLTLAVKDRILQKILFFLIALSAGGLIGGAFFHLLPESLEGDFSALTIFGFCIGGFLVFFLLERFMFWRHCHQGNCKVHPFTYLNLVGDGIHNFLDGLVIAGAFLVDVKLGLVTTLAIVLHEIPQEIGDFGVLIYGGFKKTKALFFNFFVGIIAIAGVIVGYLFQERIERAIPLVLAFTAGGFIYIAATDLIPEIKSEKHPLKSFLAFGIFVVGIILMFGLRFILKGI